MVRRQARSALTRHTRGPPAANCSARNCGAAWERSSFWKLGESGANVGGSPKALSAFRASGAGSRRCPLSSMATYDCPTPRRAAACAWLHPFFWRAPLRSLAVMAPSVHHNICDNADGPAAITQSGMCSLGAHAQSESWCRPTVFSWRARSFSGLDHRGRLIRNLPEPVRTADEVSCGVL